jgi:hypothetical protein
LAEERLGAAADQQCAAIVNDYAADAHERAIGIFPGGFAVRSQNQVSPNIISNGL